MKYIDTHAHITSKYFQKNLDDVLKRAKDNNVKYILIPGTTLQESFDALNIAKENKNLIVGIGIHPCDSSDIETKKLKKLDISEFNFIGETGIDLYHDNNPSLEVQIRSFKAHLELALKHKLPIEIHARDSYNEVYNVISKPKYKDLVFIMHSFGGDLKWAKKFIKLGCFLSFSGVVTFKNAKSIQEVAKNIPLENMIIETDSPFLTPTPHRGKENEPSYVKYIGDFIKELRTENNVLEQIYKNTLKIFKLKSNL